ncbi:MAG: VWA domain-containing protein, partial [Acidimicrobiales bacterium]|nr:VWA domain-containing protein [Acidimicrobiales bacterium]
LAIDTSESMGECHCAEGFTDTSRLPGGVTKTDIARAGAVRAIDALHADDEVGVLGIDTEARWLIDLQRVPSADVVNAGLSTVTPAGQTDLSDSLTTAAEALRQSNAGLKHIILFSDGFTQPGALANLADDAADLLEEGITVSVVATGEGAARELEPIAVAGGGRFYPGRDLTRIPEILVQESVIASRSFINEGDFLPTITGLSPVTQGLTATPSLFGFVATTAQPSATTLLTIGDEEDPLLATWQAGLGRSTAFTSDAGMRWGQAWADWDGYVDFWSTLVRDTFPQFSAGNVRTVVDGDELRIVADPADTDTARIDAVVTDPAGFTRTVQLARTATGTFEGSVRLERPGAHAVSASVVTAEGASGLGSDVASLSYSAEYRTTGVDIAVLEQLSEATGGRGGIDAAQAFDGAGLEPGRSVMRLTTLLLALAALAWLVAIALSRLWLRRRVVVGGETSQPRSEQARTRQSAAVDEVPEAPQKQPEPSTEAESASTVNALLKSKRDRST